MTNRVTLDHIDWEHIDKKKFYTIGPSLFLAVRAVTYPPALIKTRLQAQHYRTISVKSSAAMTTTATTTATARSATTTAATINSKVAFVRRGQYKNTLDVFRTIIKTDGPLALWNGFLPKTIGLIGGNVYISCYELFRSRMLKKGNHSIVANFVSGGVASLVSQIIIVPIDLISQRMAVDLDRGSMSSHLRAVWREAGLRGMYRGYAPSIMTYAPTSSIWWTTYGVTKPYAAGPTSNFVEMCTPKGEEPSKWVTERGTESLCGGLAGAVAGLLTNPMDVVKVRRQLSGKGVTTMSIVRKLYVAEGMIGFSRGATARVMGMTSNGALIVTAYECIKRLSRKDATLEN